MSEFYLLNNSTGALRDPQLTIEDPYNEGYSHHALINYFEKPQSVNIVGWQRYILVTQNPLITHVNISLPYSSELDGSFFFIDESGSADSEIIDNQEYIDLADLRTYIINFGQPTPIQNFYVYSFIVGFRSTIAGEFSDYIKIETDDETYFLRIGTDVYNEDESLSGNLENFGFEIPSAVQKAIYSSSVHEDLNDNILLNSKKRELLMNYWNIIAGKGSYKSLIDSLKWFEYGDLVRLEEYWNLKDAGRDIFVGDDLETVLDDDIENRLSYMKKTTYYGLYLLTNPNTGDIDDELNPKTEETVLRWCMEDMHLKMTLVGNFYSTYFMPIHLALLHSTVERRVYAVGLRLLNGNQISRRDYFEANCPMLLEIENEDAGLYLQDTDAYVYTDTIFGVHNIPDYFIGVEPTPRLMNLPVNPTIGDTDLAISDYAENMFSGIGKIVKFNVYIPEKWTNPNDFIWKQTILISLFDNGEEVIPDDIVTSNVSILPIEEEIDGVTHYYYKFSFWILFTNADKFKVRVQFETSERKIYTAASNIFEIKDTGNCELVPYLVEKYTREERNKEFSAENFPINFNNFAFRNTNQYGKTPNNPYYMDNDRYYMEDAIQYIKKLDENSYQTVGLNHFIGILWDKSEGIEFFNDLGDSVTIQTSDSTDTILENLENNFDYYWWDVRNPYGATIDPPTDPEDYNIDTNYVLIRGIRKSYSLLNEIVINKKYVIHYGNESATFNLINGSIEPSDTIGNFFVTVEYSYETDFLYTVKFFYDDEDNLIYKDVISLNTLMHDIIEYYDYGTADDKVHIEGNPERSVDEDRFFPILHKLVPLEEPCHIHNDQLVAIIPTFERSNNIKKVENLNFNWKFENKSDQTFFENTGLIRNSASKEPFVAKFEPASLTKGYWSAKFNISQDGNDIRTIKKESIFKVES